MIVDYRLKFMIPQVRNYPALMVPVAVGESSVCSQGALKRGASNPGGTDSRTSKLPGPNVTT